MGQAINIFIAILLYAATILVLIATVFAAYAAIKSYFVSHSVLYYQLMARYSSSEMGKALEIMWELYHTREQDPEKTAFIQILKQYRDCFDKKDFKNTPLKVSKTISTDKSSSKYVAFFGYSYEETNKARRQLSHFFTTAHEMFTEIKVLNKACFEKICKVESFELLYYVVEWFELANNPKRKREEYTKLLHESGLPKDKIDELEKARPPETWDEVKKMKTC